MTKRFDTVAIIGVGLIGGSIGLGLRKRGLADRVIGIGRRQSSLNAAFSVQAVTETTTDIALGVRDAGLIVVCTPASHVVASIRAAAAAAPANCVLTDAASTKASIVQSLDQDVANGLAFVGSHPIAGSHRTGPEAADADLFVDRHTIVSPSAATHPDHVKIVCEFWNRLGSQTHTISAEQHDQILANTSHLPHVVAAVLAATTPETFVRFAGTGWCDATRIAAGNPTLWLDIVQENRTELISAMEQFGHRLSAFEKALKANDQQTILDLFEQGKQRRDGVGN